MEGASVDGVGKREKDPPSGRGAEGAGPKVHTTAPGSGDSQDPCTEGDALCCPLPPKGLKSRPWAGGATWGRVRVTAHPHESNPSDWSAHGDACYSSWCGCPDYYTQGRDPNACGLFLRACHSWPVICSQGCSSPSQQPYASSLPYKRAR